MQEPPTSSNCTVCAMMYGEGLKEPFTLPVCFHTFCKECINTLASTHSCKCPVCRKPFTPGSERRNFALCDLISEISQRMSSLSVAPPPVAVAAAASPTKRNLHVLIDCSGSMTLESTLPSATDEGIADVPTRLAVVKKLTSAIKRAVACFYADKVNVVVHGFNRSLIKLRDNSEDTAVAGGSTCPGTAFQALLTSLPRDEIATSSYLLLTDGDPDNDTETLFLSTLANKGLLSYQQGYSGPLRMAVVVFSPDCNRQFVSSLVTNAPSILLSYIHDARTSAPAFGSTLDYLLADTFSPPEARLSPEENAIRLEVVECLSRIITASRDSERVSILDAMYARLNEIVASKKEGIDFANLMLRDIRDDERDKENSSSSSSRFGQISQAVVHYGTWGVKYLAGLLTAHRAALPTNTYEASFTRYMTPHYQQTVNVFSHALVTLPPWKDQDYATQFSDHAVKARSELARKMQEASSKNLKLAAMPGVAAHGGGSAVKVAYTPSLPRTVAARSSAIDLSQTYYGRNAGCINGDARVIVKIPGIDKSVSVTVKTLRKGFQIKTSHTDSWATVRIVQMHEIDTPNPGGLVHDAFTPNHPVWSSHTRSWTWASQYYGQQDPHILPLLNDFDGKFYVYNIVFEELNQRFSVSSPSGDFCAITCGLGSSPSSIVAHPFFGTQAVVDQLASIADPRTGIAYTQESKIKRDPDTGLVCSLF